MDNLIYEEFEPDEEIKPTYEIVVRLVVIAESEEEAEDAVNEVIQEGKLKVIDEHNEDTIYEYDIETTEPTYIHML